MLIIIIVIWGYIQFKKNYARNAVYEYLIEEKHIPEGNIKFADPFIANLRGSKNWMVAVGLKGDEKVYYYYKDKNKIILESWTENGVEY